MSKRQIIHNPFTPDEQLHFALAYEANAAAFAIALAEAAGGQTWCEPDFTLALFPFAHSISLRQIAYFTNKQGASLGVLASSVQGAQFYPRLGSAHVDGYPIYSYTP